MVTVNVYSDELVVPFYVKFIIATNEETRTHLYMYFKTLSHLREFDLRIII